MTDNTSEQQYALWRKLPEEISFKYCYGETERKKYEKTYN